MKLKLLAIATVFSVFFPSIAYASKMVEIPNAAGNINDAISIEQIAVNGTYPVFIDPDSIKRQGNIVTFWLYHKAFWTPDNKSVRGLLEEANCTDRTYRLVKIVLYDAKGVIRSQYQSMRIKLTKEQERRRRKNLQKSISDFVCAR